MKKLSLLFLSALLVFTACDNDDNADMLTEADVARIVAQAISDANLASTAEVTSAVTAAVTAAMANGVDINQAIQDALDAQNATPATQTVGIPGGVTFIDDSQTWTNDRIWHMFGKVVVRDGGVLNIQAGTIIKAGNETGADASVLVIAKGGQILAVGTADAPIIFTDIDDEIDYDDNGVSPNRLPTDMGRWGSVVVLGKALVGEDGGEDDIEGIADGFSWTTYGGTNDADNSGRLEYVSIRHSGQTLTGDNELQGLTLGGVGSGTTVENIEIIGSSDDGIEIFGGSVNVTNLIIHMNGDDAIDLDEGYKGTISNAVIVLDDDTDGAFEIDGTEDSTGGIDGQYTLQNVTVYGNTVQEDTNQYGTWKSDATGLNQNIVFKSFNTGTTIEGIDADTYAGQGTATAAGSLFFNNFDFITSDALSTIMPDNVTDGSTWAEVLATQASSTGADESVFAWTLYFSAN
ncbi:MAG: hypothetical protein ACPGC8_01255 [Flavobacteriaceae bacterium]